MKLKKLIKCSLAMALVFGTATVLTGCGKEDGSSKNDSKQYQIYKMALDAGATDLTYEEWLVSIKGAKGDPGNDGHTPDIKIGQNGNWFIDNVDTQVKATGSTGETGAAGTKWTVSTTDPNNANGSEGDFHLNSLTQTIFCKENGIWVQKTVISDGTNGRDGKQVEFNVTTTHIQWRYIGDQGWSNLLPLEDIQGVQGDPGKQIKIQVNTTANTIEWQYEGDATWNTLTSLDALKGDTGATGNGIASITKTATNGNVDTYTITFTDNTMTPVTFNVTNGANGENGTNGENGVSVKTATINASGNLILTLQGPNGETEVDAGKVTGAKGEAGRGIASVEKTTEGNVDTYTITYTDTTTYEFTVTNGRDGKDGVSVVGITTSADKWGIKVTHTFVMSDETTKETEYVVVDQFRTYDAESEEDITTLLNYGVSKIGLADDVELTHAIVVDRKLTFNLNDHEISIPTDAEGNGVFYVPVGGNLTIEGDGIVNGASDYNDYGMAVWADGGDVTINGGTFTNVGTKGYEDDKVTRNNNEVVYAKNGGRVTINGGEFIGEHPRWTLNSHNTKKGVIVVNGGKFYNFDPSSAMTDDDGAYTPTDYLGAGCYSINNGNFVEIEKEQWYYENAVGVKNERELLNAIEEAQYRGEVEIYLTKDFEVSTAVVIENAYVRINLNGKKISAPNDTVGDGIFKVVQGGNLEIVGQGIVDSATLENDYSMAVWALDGGRVRINGGIFTNVGAKAYEDDGTTPNNNEVIYVRRGGMVEINGGTFIGNNSRWVLNSHNTELGYICVNGGTFVEFDPSNAMTDDGGTNPHNYVSGSATVTKVTSSGTTAYVVTETYNGGGYEEPLVGKAVASKQDILDAIKDGETYVHLTSNFDIGVKDPETNMAAIIVTGNLTVDLNGYTITAVEDNGGDGVFYVPAGGNLTINDSRGGGMINATSQNNDYSMAVWADGGTVTINGGIFTNVGAKTIDPEGSINNNEVIYVKNGGNITIRGGTFVGNNSRWVLNSNNDHPGTITVYGGYFVDFDPSNALTDDEGASVYVDYLGDQASVSSFEQEGMVIYEVTFDPIVDTEGIEGIKYTISVSEDDLMYELYYGCYVVLSENSNSAWLVNPDPEIDAAVVGTYELNDNSLTLTIYGEEMLFSVEEGNVLIPQMPTE